MSTRFSVALLHGAGYGGGELIRLALQHPALELVQVTSRTFAGQSVSVAHPALFGQTSLHFSDDDALDPAVDAVFIAAEHGQSAKAVKRLFEMGFAGKIVDLSADFRFADPAHYPAWLGFDHPCPEHLPKFQYRIPELHPLRDGIGAIANPGCFATAISCALYPIAQEIQGVTAHVTALTGASGSGAKPSAGTHFPTREGNVRAYKVLSHQHAPEVQHVIGPGVNLQFVPVSGPWTRGIWGTAHLDLPAGWDLARVQDLYRATYPEGGAVRLWHGLPELRYSVNTPYCDLGFALHDRHLVIGFGIDNLLKGAASQAVQNLNALLGLPSLTGLVPSRP